MVEYIVLWINGFFGWVGVHYDFTCGIYDGTFTTYSIHDAYDQLVAKSFCGGDAKGYWSYKDFGGAYLGWAGYGGSNMVAQFAPDAEHWLMIPDSDFERAYITTHEFGHNSNAIHEDGWESTDCCWHTHRSFMIGSAWNHYHDCWSVASKNRITAFRGTSWSGTPCD